MKQLQSNISVNNNKKTVKKLTHEKYNPTNYILSLASACLLVAGIVGEVRILAPTFTSPCRSDCAHIADPG